MYAHLGQVLGPFFLSQNANCHTSGIFLTATQHGHAHDAPKKKESGHDHSHGHGHEEPKKESGHDHSHGHGHDAKKDDMPAWKKKALESGSSDPMAAPFGGSWNVESSLSAKDDKMEE